MAGIFQFKQFSVDQSGCAMKINTDGVLLGALTEATKPQNILDIGTGTGVIALMLAHRFTSAHIDAVEIDKPASVTALQNFKNSPFAERLTVFQQGFQSYFNEQPEKKYDLIVSNPPFHLNSLESPKANKTIAKHTDKDFFEDLITGISQHLTKNGLCWLILPLPTAGLVKELALFNGLYLKKKITIHSFMEDIPHREILAFGINDNKLKEEKFVIYKEPKVYSEMYIAALKDFFTIF
ncbi:MAG: tRNA1(Val) (adenine(37)-N6)-methyltransferase [Sphingobacteriales bacterium]